MSLTLMGRSVATIAAALVAASSALLSVPSADATPVTDQGRHGPVLPNVIPTTVISAVDPTVVPQGVNTGCIPNDGRNPVVLLHGMNSSGYSSWANLGPQLANDGLCVYSLTYGANKGIWPLAGNFHGFNGLALISESYPEVREFINTVRDYTGAKQVDLVGYSLGGTMATKYAKEFGAERVGTVVTLGGVLGGTNLFGAGQLARQAVGSSDPLKQAVDLTAGPVTLQLLQGSDEMVALNDGGIQAPGVKYVSISSRTDAMVTPLANSQFHGPNSEAYVLQDGCNQDLSDHLGLPFSPRAQSIVRRSLGVDTPLQCGPGLLIASDWGSAGSSNNQPNMGPDYFSSSPS